MALGKALIGAASFSALAIACTCSAPPGLCSRLEPNMVAFIGHPVSTRHIDKGRTQTTFKIEERLWGVSSLDFISVDGVELSSANLQKSWFVLAGRRTDNVSTNGGSYFVDFQCCPYGLLLPIDHAAVNEFRHNVVLMKPATMGVEIKSNGKTLADFKLQLNGPGYEWQGISSEWPTNLKLPPGDYSVGITKSYFTLPEANRRTSILPGACTTWSIIADPTSTISGSIVDSRGLSAQGISYSLEGEVTLDTSLVDSAILAVRRSWHRMMGWAGTPDKRISYLMNPDSAGRFQVHVLPGKYRLSAVSADIHNYVFPPPIPKTYYPGVMDAALATEIVVTTGGDVGEIRFEFPDYGPTRRVEVVLVNDDGSPASNKVVAHTGTYPGEPYRTTGWTQKLTDSRGRAIFDVWQALEYDLQIGESASGDSHHIRAGSEPISRRLVLHRWRPSAQR